MLKYLDLFPKQISLHHKKVQLFRNNFSTIVSIIIICGMIASTIFFGRNFFERLNPQVIFKSSPTGNFHYYKQNSSNFFAAAALTDFSRKALPLDDTLFSIKFIFIEHLTVDGKEIWNVRNFNATPCNKMNITNSFYNKLISENNFLDGFMCADVGNFVFGGDASQNNESWVDIVVRDCANTTTQKNCKQSSEIKNFFYDKHFIVNTLDHYAEVDDYSHPIKDKRIYFSKYISYQFYQGVQVLYETLTVKTDAGMIFESLEEQSTLQIKDEINNFSIYPDETPWARTLVQYTLKINNSLTEHKRKYMKAQELSAFIGGIFSVYLIFGRIVIFMVTDNFFYHDLANSLYSFKDVNVFNKVSPTLETQQKFRARMNTIEISPDFFISSPSSAKLRRKSIASPKTTVPLKTHQKSTKYLASNSSRKLNLSICELLCYSFSCKKDEKKLKKFTYVKQEIESSLEVSKKIKLYKEFDLLMSLVLNKNERVAFKNQNYLFFKKSSNQIMEDNRNVEEMIEYFKLKFRTNTMTEKDNQLLNSLKSNLTERIIFQS
jgi:hypothetical protein